MKLTGAKLDGFLRSPDKAIRAVLLFGPDAGLVRERGKALADMFADPGDPFSLQEFAADALKKDGSLLADGSRSLSLMGGAPVMRIRDVTDALVATIEEWLEAGAGVHPGIFEAGELTPRSKLRALFEKRADTAAIGCYADAGGDLRSLVSAHFSANKVRIDSEAMALLLNRLGSDRLAIRQELDKLILYAGPGNDETMIRVSDVEEVIGDAKSSSLDDVAFAVGGGDLRLLDSAMGRARAENLDVPSVIRAVLRHLDRLHDVAAEVAAGASTEVAMKKLKPPVFFKLTGDFARQVRAWSAPDLARGLRLLLETERQAKSGIGIEWAICERTLMQLTQAARRTGR